MISKINSTDRTQFMQNPRIYTMHLEKDASGHINVAGSSTKEITQSEFVKRITKPFAELSIQRVIGKKTSVVDKSILHIEHTV